MPWKKIRGSNSPKADTFWQRLSAKVTRLRAKRSVQRSLVKKKQALAAPSKVPAHKPTHTKLKPTARLLRSLLIGLVTVLVLSTLGVATLVGQRILTFNPNQATIPWTGKTNMTIVLLGVSEKAGGLKFIDSIQLVYLRPNQNSVNVLAVDPDLTINVADSATTSLGKPVRTRYTFRQLYNYYLAQAELANVPFEQRPQQALTQFIATLQGELGVYLDRYFMLSSANFSKVLDPFSLAYVDGSWRNLDEQLQYVGLTKPGEKDADARLQRQAELVKRYLLDLGQPVQSARLLALIVRQQDWQNNFNTNFSGPELWQLYLNLRNLSEYKLGVGITANTDCYYFAESKYLDKHLFDEKIQKLYRNQEVLVEQARIDVINATGVSGLASRYARLLSNSSFNVVRTDNSDKPYAQSTLFVPEPEKYPGTIKQLQQIVPHLLISKEEYPLRPTGDMVLVLVV